MLSSTGCNSPVLAADCALRAGAADSRASATNSTPDCSRRLGKFLVVDGEYIWKYTHTGYDFSILGNTPIFFPIGWHNSKIPGWALRASVPVNHGFSALVVMSSVAARFFPPQAGGLGVTVGQSGYPFRIDHDEVYNMTTHMQYQTPWKRGPWFGFNWRYDSGLVAGAVPCYDLPFNNCPTSTTLNGQPAIRSRAAVDCRPGVPGRIYLREREMQLRTRLCLTRAWLRSSDPSSSGSRRPALKMMTTIRSVSRPRNLFDIAVGDDNLFMGDQVQVEPAIHCDQRDQQVRAVQLPVNLQRDALRHAAGVDSAVGVPLLGNFPVVWVRGEAPVSDACSLRSATRNLPKPGGIFSLACNSRPDIPGIRMSTIRYAAWYQELKRARR